MKTGIGMAAAALLLPLSLAACGKGGQAGNTAQASASPALLAGPALAGQSTDASANVALEQARREPGARAAELRQLAARPQIDALFATPAIGAQLGLQLLGTEFRLTPEAIEERGSGVTELFALVEDNGGKGGGNAVMTRRGDEITATLFLPGRTIQLHSIDARTALALEIDPTNYPIEEPAGFTDPIPNPPGPAQPQAAQAARPIEISVLQLFSSAAERKATTLGFTSLAQFADQAIAASNLAMTNTRLDVRFTSAGTHVLTSFVENGDYVRDVDTLGASAPVAAERKRVKADVAMLHLAAGTKCGRARDILARKDTAYGVVNIACAIGNFSLAHEIGHLIGACHEDDPQPPRPYARGFGLTGPTRDRSARTVMAYPAACGGECERQPVWSSPTAKFPLGQVTAVTAGSATRDNARAIREGAAYVATFGENL